MVATITGCGLQIYDQAKRKRTLVFQTDRLCGENIHHLYFTIQETPFRFRK